MTLQTIGIVGLGFTGRSIAACLLWKGLNVVGYTRPVEGYAAARQSISDDMEDIIAHGAADASLRHQWTSHYVEAQELAGLKDCDFVIEAVPEDLALKRSVFAEIEKVIGENVPLASNTSALPITLLQEGLKHPQRFIGMHWAAPCQVNRFLEVIRGDHSGDAAMNAAVELAKRAGREPGVVNKDIPGFVVNRLAYAVYREALHLMDEGVADAQTIDNVFSSVLGMWGSVMGPMRWIDLSGFALYAKVMERLLPTLDNSTTVPRVFQELIESGAKGANPQNGGRGFYNYTPEQVRQWHKVLVENGWSMYKLKAQYDKEFPETKGS
jgi:3-hydroxybutyryl-CoA dehydrogenase